MAYATGTATSPSDLLQQLAAWLENRGWTRDESAAEGSGWRAHLHKSGLFVNFRAAVNESLWPAAGGGSYDRAPGYGIGLYLGTGYDGKDAWHLQAGRPLNSAGGTAGCGVNLPSGAIAGYHFFSASDHIIAAIERAPGIFGFLAWGPSMAKIGFANDYPYFFASSSQYRNADPGPLVAEFSGINVSAHAPTSHADLDADFNAFCATAFVKVDMGIFGNQWISNFADGGWSSDRPREGYTGMMMRSMLTPKGPSYSPNAGEYPSYQYLLGRAHQVAFTGGLLLPLHCFLQRPTTLRWALVGYPSSVNWCTAVGHGFAAKEIYQVGGLDYMLFPNFAVRKTS